MHENANLILFLIMVIIASRLSTLLKKVGQPALLGELGFGMLIAVFGFLNIKFFQMLPQNQTLALFSELGAIFLLFEIGLESDVKLLRKNGSYAIIIAIVGAVFPFSLGYAFASYFVPQASQNFCLFIAASLSATSTGISVRIFKEYRLSNSTACQLVLAASIIDDILSLIVLTCITSLVTTGGFSYSSLILIPIKICIFFIMLYFAIKILLPRFFSIDKKNDSLDLALIIITCLAASWLANSVGLSSIIGAFLAGLFIDKTYFKGKDHLILPLIWIFVPLFFIYSGMQVDINSFLNLHTLLMSLLLSAVAIISKVLPAILIPHRSKMITKLAIGFGMVPRGEIGLIIAIIGKQIGVLNNEYFNIITLMVVITSFCAPILLNLIIKRLKQHTQV